MSAYQGALVIDAASSKERLALASGLIERCEGVVMLEGLVALRATPDAIRCEVIDTMSGGHRCEEEFKVLVENAARTLAASRLSAWLPARPLRWVVVEERGTGAVQLWPTS